MSNSLRKLRIIAMPLTRPNVGNRIPAKPSRLVYYQFQLTTPVQLSSTRLASGDHDSTSTSAKKKGWLPKEGIAKWTTNKVADVWAGFGKAKSGWKLKVYQAGERMVDRMEFEELALKSIDLSTCPPVAHFRSTPVSDNEKAPLGISLVFPPSFFSPSEVLSELRGYAQHRILKHRKGFYFWMLVAPMTAPFIIIPIIPNLPFFFCAWRSWSHYRAYRSSQYLQSLLDHDIIVPETSEPLDEVYKSYALTPTPSASYDDPDSASNKSNSEYSIPKTNPHQEPQHTLLLDPEAVPAILSLFGLESTTSVDLHRAIEQARLRVASGRV